MPNWDAEPEQLLAHGQVFAAFRASSSCSLLCEHLNEGFDMASELLFGSDPTVLPTKFLLITVNYPRQLLSRLLRVVGAFKLRPQFLPLVLPDVNRITPVAVAVLAAVRWQTRSALALGDLAQTGLALLAEGFHALATAAVFDHEMVVLLSEAILLDADFTSSSFRVPPLALLLTLRLLALFLS